ncbi:hypothetical protein [Aquimarina sp. AU474]|uniref:hypothetical protein n=1 Tax=Aquimarina sp. AU474 TaxID=2108529 RepID=UPI000D687008|nr:hypothetical protein [Aquimarina sp. AU474]
MKSSTLLFRSLAILILIAGSAHLVSYASINSESPKSNRKEDTNNTPVSETENSKTSTTSEIENKESINYSTDYIIGKWEVAYTSKDFKGVVIYNLKKEKGIFNAYTYQYENESGDIEQAKKSKVLIIEKFDGYKGAGKYLIDYEGKQYDVKCNIDMINENTFKLSYDYYGYSDVETWKKL